MSENDLIKVFEELASIKNTLKQLERLEFSTTASLIAAGFSKGVSKFGSGIDGDVTITGTTTLTRDMYYNDLTITNTGVLIPAGFLIFVKGKLSIAAGGKIQSDGSNGEPASGATPGAGGAGAVTVGLNFYKAGAGGAGATGGSAGTLNGSAGTAGGSPSGLYGKTPRRTIAGCGGGGGGNHGNVARAGVSGENSDYGPSAGSGGAGIGSNSLAYGGGGGGGGGGCIEIYANEIDNAGTISADGGNGGDGIGSSATRSGGGGGGSGGLILIFYGTTSGSGVGTLTATGGVHGGGAWGNAGTDGSDGFSASYQI
jgi:hypothetical protein